MAEVIRTGRVPATPAPGLLKKGEKDEEGLEGNPCFVSLSPLPCHTSQYYPSIGYILALGGHVCHPIKSLLYRNKITDRIGGIQRRELPKITYAGGTLRVLLVDNSVYSDVKFTLAKRLLRRETMKKIRVLVVDDHPVFREGLCRLLKNDKEVDCIRVAGDGEEAIELTRELLPDVVLIDIAMPKMDGIQAAKQIKAVCPAAAVIVLSAYAYDYYILACIEAGVNGYLLKSTPRIELINAIRMVHAGNIMFSLEATGKVLHLLTAGRDKGQEAVTSAKLHSRELQVLRLAAKGITNKQIAHELGITGNTVGTHFINIFRKLGVESRTQAILYALKEGMFTLDDIVLKTGYD